MKLETFYKSPENVQRNVYTLKGNKQEALDNVLSITLKCIGKKGLFGLLQ